MYCLKRSVILFSIVIVALSQMNNYKPYRLSWDYFTTCNSPKSSSCALAQINKIENMTDVILILNVTRNCPIQIAKIITGTYKENSTTKMITYNLDKPCDHFIIGPILANYVTSSKECQLAKGNYVVHLNMVHNSKTFLGTKFFYGTYKFKMMFYNKKYNFVCIETVFRVNNTGDYK